MSTAQSSNSCSAGDRRRMDCPRTSCLSLSSVIWHPQAQLHSNDVTDTTCTC
jgi:hypothetical protein